MMASGDTAPERHTSRSSHPPCPAGPSPPHLTPQPPGPGRPLPCAGGGSRGRGPRAGLQAVPHSGVPAFAGGRCQQALAGSELRSDSRHRCPCFNSSAMEPGRPGGGGGGSAAPGATGTAASPTRPGRRSGDSGDPAPQPAGVILPCPSHKTGGRGVVIPLTITPIPAPHPRPQGSPREGATGLGGGSGAASAARRSPRAGSLRFFMVSAILAEICL